METPHLVCSSPPPSCILCQRNATSTVPCRSIRHQCCTYCFRRLRIRLLTAFDIGRAFPALRPPPPRALRNGHPMPPIQLATKAYHQGLNWLAHHQAARQPFLGGTIHGKGHASPRSTRSHHTAINSCASTPNSTKGFGTNRSQRRARLLAAPPHNPTLLSSGAHYRPRQQRST